MTGWNRLNQACGISMAGRNPHQFWLAARAGASFHHHLGNWESSNPVGQFSRVIHPEEAFAEELPKSMTVLAKRHNLYPVVDHRVLYSGGFGFPAGGLAPIVLLDFARAISCVPGPIARVL